MKVQFDDVLPPTQAQLEKLGRALHLQVPDVPDEGIEARRRQLAQMGRAAAVRLREDAPALYDKLVAELDAAGAFQQRAEDFVREMIRQGKPVVLSDIRIDVDAVCQATGDLMMEAAVWQSVVSPSLVDRLREWAYAKSAEAPRRPVQPFQKGSMIWNRTEAEDAFKGVLQQWIATLQASPREQHLRELEAERASVQRDGRISGFLAGTAVTTAMINVVGGAAVIGAARIAEQVDASVGPIAICAGAATGVVAWFAGKRADAANQQSDEMFDEMRDHHLRHVDDETYEGARP